MSTGSADVAVVVGNPQSPSRTSAAAALVAKSLSTITGGSVSTIELAELGPALLAWGDPSVQAAKDAVLAAGALVVASPTYKAAYTGLTKLFLDRFDRDELGGLPTVAMMTGGSPAHSLAVEVHLRPVLVEIGASCPARGLYLQGPEIDEPTGPVDAWFSVAEPVLRQALARP